MIIPPIFTRFLSFSILAFAIACQTDLKTQAQQEKPDIFSPTVAKPKLTAIENESIKKLLESAIEQTSVTKGYDPAYVVLPYPNGDVPIETGVCSDVVIRSFRNAGVDLQKEIHEDMSKSFSSYPKKWGLKKADANIDHRRVPNLQKYFERRGKSLPVTDKAADYKPGDVVAWDLDGRGLTHIGLVSNIWNETSKRYLIIHNIGGGAEAEDRVFDWKIIGHYRYF